MWTALPEPFMQATDMNDSVLQIKRYYFKQLGSMKNNQILPPYIEKETRVIFIGQSITETYGRALLSQ